MVAMNDTLQQPQDDQPHFAFVPKRNWSVVIAYSLGIFILIALFAKSYGFFMNTKNGELPTLEESAIESSQEPSADPSTGLAPLLNETQNGNAAVVQPVESSYRAFVATKNDGSVYIVPIDAETEPFLYTKYGEMYNGGSLGHGETGPELSPDLEKFAFVKDGKLVVVSADTKTEQIIPLENVTYITGWSRDGSKLIAYVTSNSIKNIFESGGPGYETPTEAVINPAENPTGFYLIDFAAGTIRHMHELNDMLVYEWVDGDAIIVSNGLGQYELFSYYNLATHTVNTEMVKKLSEVFGQQMSFSSDGKKWSTVTSVEQNSTDMAQITMGNFPNFGDIARIEVPWARKQGPVMSPTGDKVAIWGSRGDASDGEVHIYRGTTIDYIAEGRPRVWLDNDRLLYVNNDVVYTYNFANSETKQLN